MNFKGKYLLGSSLTAVMVATAVPAVSAQDASSDDVAIEEVLVTGSRRAARSAGDTPAPVDVISGDQFTNQANGDLSSLLRNVVPSYNVNSQPINDAATLVRPANLRGLAPDQTLVLVNNKRRHRAAVITFLGSGLSDGAQGADISAIPALALKQVDVLRDGAAAQYGSDAIAGVINFKLNDASEGGTLEAKYSSTYEGDGDAIQISGNVGFGLGDTGFVNITGEWREIDATSRSVQRPDAQNLALGAAPFRDPAQIWGKPEVNDDIKIVINAAYELTDDLELYAFGNYAERQVIGGFYYRNPDTRGGVFSGDGGVTRLVGDLTPNDGMDCPVVGVNDQAAYDSVVADPNCFIFNELFPGGFTPNFGGDLEDLSMYGGIRGSAGGWDFDLSASYGENEVAYFIFNTVNASLGPNTPTSFNPGTDEQRETNVNLDLVKEFEVGLASPLNVAMGVEWREEEFSRVAGDPAAYRRGPLFDQGFSSGSNGFNGFPPSSAGTWNRTNWAAYLDLEADVTDQLILGGAIRWEDFSTFGSTVNGKISMLYRASDTFTIRSTASTGFRAPSPGQTNVTSVSTSINEDGLLVDEGLIPPASDIAIVVGQQFGVEAGELGEEKSKSFTFGFGWDMGAGSLTIDAFHIEVDDRISVSDSIALSAAEAQAIEDGGIPGAANFRGVQWFQNAFDTRTQGIDVVYNRPLELTADGVSNLTVSANYTKTKVTAGSIGGSIREDLLENALPNFRGNVTLTHAEDKWRGLLRLNYHGKWMEYFAGFLRNESGAELNIDVEAAYSLTDYAEVVVGVENLFDNFADVNPQGGQDFGALYPESSPFGIDGGVYYAKVRLTF